MRHKRRAIADGPGHCLRKNNAFFGYDDPARVFGAARDLGVGVFPFR